MHHTNETRALAKNSFKENYRSSALSCTLSSDLPCLTRIINRKLNISPKILLQNSVTKAALGDRSCGKHERVGEGESPTGLGVCILNRLSPGLEL